MPRLPQNLLLRAHSISPLLPLILRTTRELPSAINELRWLREHAKETKSCCPSHARHALLAFCKRRERGEPLQYILGTQPFGELEIKCSPGVLIPRPETEAYTMYLARLLNEDRLQKFITREHCPYSSLLPHKKSRGTRQPEDPSLKILDLCSGSGCISLLLHSQLTDKFPNLSIRGWDISRKALSLANENLRFNIEKGGLGQAAKDQLHFHEANIFKPPSDLFHQLEEVDIIISNPPYISQKHFMTETTRSVRNWEPRLALVPEQMQIYRNHNTPVDLKRSIAREDIFYNELIRLHTRRNRCKVLLMEIGDSEQALRVVAMALCQPHIARSNRVEIWRDWPDQDPQTSEESEVDVEGKHIPVVGTGKMRAVVLFLDRPEPVIKMKKPPGKAQRKLMRRKEKRLEELRQDPGGRSPDRKLKIQAQGPGTFGIGSPGWGEV